jgi:predicted DNA-binding transcriptional regulator AlpA
MDTRSRSQNLKASELAARWSVSLQMVHKLRKQGEFPGAFQVGSDWRFPVSDVEAYEQRNSQRSQDASKTESGVTARTKKLFRKPGKTNAVIGGVA